MHTHDSFSVTCWMVMSECEILVMFMETILWELHVGHIKQDFEN